QRGGVARGIVTLPQWRAHLLERLASDALVSGDPALAVLRDELASYPGGESDDGLDPGFADIAVPLRLRHDGAELSFISTKTSFATAVDVTVAELSIESFFPADSQTAEAMRALSLRDVPETAGAATA